ncbi:MAG: Hsp20/alpha crystallin family protein [Bacilli bacterium]|nr:Hsp20/alpha crystallin family protein [Bacilli bacterium]MDD4809451.1 Hsp20/alpha crystallin family protein [Bacilli bacterium]
MNLLTRNFYLDDLFDGLITSAKGNDMKCDIYEKDGDYKIEMDIPGFDKKDIEIEINNGYLNITAEKKEETNDEGKNYIRRERSYGKYQRSFYLGDIEVEKIDAEFKDGLLKISIPKAEEKEIKKLIEIK